jgi:trimethylamine:corrinoid methyltransferase-like protein
VANANVLAVIVISQAPRPSLPVTYQGIPHVIGIGGSFLGAAHTRRRYARRFARTIWPTGRPGKLSSAGGQDTLQRAASEVDRLLSLPPAPPPKPEQEHKIAAQIDAALKELNAA